MSNKIFHLHGKTIQSIYYEYCLSNLSLPFKSWLSKNYKFSDYQINRLHNFQFTKTAAFLRSKAKMERENGQ